MPVPALVHIGIDAQDLEPWRAFGTAGFAPLQVTRGQYHEVE